MTFDLTPYLDRSEGSHFERKSLFEGEPPRRQPCDRRAVRDEIARQVAGFANAEGGVLILGIDDDGTLSGHGYPAQVVDVMLRVPTDRLDPPQAPGFRLVHAGVELLVFDVAMASEPVQVIGDGYPLRMGESTVQVRFDQIQALKVRGLAESFEARPSPITLAELDTALLDEARSGAGLSAGTATDYLLRRRLADLRGQSLVLRQAAELLFHRLQPEHPNAGIRIFRVVGTERRTGLEHNVEELPRIEGSLPRVLQETYEVIARLLRRPSRLTPGGRFRRFSEYPDFSWKEAILNAVGHRDYGVQGRGIEVWLFDDRMEVTSPGGLVPEVTLEELLTLKRVHYSRNPRLVRTLVDLGFMRDQGEGLPRMFAEMEGQFLPAPELEVLGGVVRLTLRNTMTLSDADRAFIENLGDHELSPPEFRALLEAHRHGRVDNEGLRVITGLDTLGASKLLRGLRDRGLLVSQAKGSATYYVLAEATPTLEGDDTDLDSQGPVGLPDSEGPGRASKVMSSTPKVISSTPKVGSSTPKVTSSAPKVTSSAPKVISSAPKVISSAPKVISSAPKVGSSTPRVGSASTRRRRLSRSTPLEPILMSDEDSLLSDAPGLDPEHDVPAALRSEIASLGNRPGPSQLRRLILRLCEHAPREIATLSAILHRNSQALARHVRILVEEGALRPRFPDRPTHRHQAYITVQRELDIKDPE